MAHQLISASAVTAFCILGAAATNEYDYIKWTCSGPNEALKVSYSYFDDDKCDTKNNDPSSPLNPGLVAISAEGKYEFPSCAKNTCCEVDDASENHHSFIVQCGQLDSPELDRTGKMQFMYYKNKVCSGVPELFFKENIPAKDDEISPSTNAELASNDGSAESSCFPLSSPQYVKATCSNKNNVPNLDVEYFYDEECQDSSENNHGVWTKSDISLNAGEQWCTKVGMGDATSKSTYVYQECFENEIPVKVKFNRYWRSGVNKCSGDVVALNREEDLVSGECTKISEEDENQENEEDENQENEEDENQENEEDENQEENEDVSTGVQNDGEVEGADQEGVNEEEGARQTDSACMSLAALSSLAASLFMATAGVSC